TLKKKERVVRVWEVTRCLHRVEEGRVALQKRRVEENLILGNYVGPKEIQHRQQHADFVRARLPGSPRMNSKRAEFIGVLGSSLG
ncbi:MAG: hypothetical protein EB072_22590, partial [Betaproteobacteria bacterium]|nr:hypothetical protein [Betaproteobacteria bacterium]